VDLNKNFSEYTQGTVDSDNIEIRYSLRPMTSLWRHICKRLYTTNSRQNAAYSQYNSTTYNQ